MDIGFYITDASFDRNTKVSVISFIEKTTNTSKTYQETKFKNIFEAEKEGIINCVKDSIGRFKDVIVFCDNKSAVYYARKEFVKKLMNKFDSIQFVWLPREFMSEVDFLTKNISNTKENQQIKNSSYINNLSNTLLIKPEKQYILKHIHKILNKIPKDFKFTSIFFRNLYKDEIKIDNSDRSNIEEDILNISYFLNDKDITFLRNLVIVN